LGTWQLGLEYLGYGGNGEYGQDTALITHTLVADDALSMSGVLIAAINTTDYLNGLFGLGITQGNFGGKVAMSPLTQAVQKAGWIPSYSYGYTAGASYRTFAIRPTPQNHILTESRELTGIFNSWRISTGQVHKSWDYLHLGISR
jgi:hypothetical protein